MGPNSPLSPFSPLKLDTFCNLSIFFCHGTEDELVPFSEGRALYAAYAGPKDCYWVPGASHYNIRRYHKDEYLRRLRGFLQGVLDSELRPTGSLATWPLSNCYTMSCRDPRYNGIS